MNFFPQINPLQSIIFLHSWLANIGWLGGRRLALSRSNQKNIYRECTMFDRPLWPLMSIFLLNSPFSPFLPILFKLLPKGLEIFPIMWGKTEVYTWLFFLWILPFSPFCLLSLNSYQKDNKIPLVWGNTELYTSPERLRPKVTFSLRKRFDPP